MPTDFRVNGKLWDYTKIENKIKSYDFLQIYFFFTTYFTTIANIYLI